MNEKEVTAIMIISNLFLRGLLLLVVGSGVRGRVVGRRVVRGRGRGIGSRGVGSRGVGGGQLSSGGEAHQSQRNNYLKKV